MRERAVVPEPEPADTEGMNHSVFPDRKALYWVIMKRTTRVAILTGAAMLLIVSCTFSESLLRLTPARPAPAGTTDTVRPEPDRPIEADPASGLTKVQVLLKEGADRMIGERQLVVRGKRFNYDCTGTVLAIYYHAGIDLAVRFGRYSGNGVNRLFRTLEDEQLIYTTELPVTGDLIFWDNTYDKNGDRAWNDPLTHVGMVTGVADDGTISYVHLNYSKGITVEYMNLLDTETNVRVVDGRNVILNSPMRMRGAQRTPRDRWLAGQLYRSFGMGYRFGG